MVARSKVSGAVLTDQDCGLESHRGHGCLSCKSCVLSGRGLYDGLITRPEESYRALVFLTVIRCNSNAVHRKCVGRRDQTNGGEQVKSSILQHFIKVQMCSEISGLVLHM